MQEPSKTPPLAQTEAFLSALVGKPIIVHTLVSGQETSARYGAPQAATLYGRLEANYPDALVIEMVENGQPRGDRILVYKRAIVAIEARSAMTP